MTGWCRVHAADRHCKLCFCSNIVSTTRWHLSQEVRPPFDRGVPSVTRTHSPAVFVPSHRCPFGGRPRGLRVAAVAGGCASDFDDGGSGDPAVRCGVPAFRCGVPAFRPDPVSAIRRSGDPASWRFRRSGDRDDTATRYISAYFDRLPSSAALKSLPAERFAATEGESACCSSEAAGAQPASAAPPC